MRFLRRSLVGLFLLAVSVALLTLGGQVTWDALQIRWADDAPARRAQERVFAVNVLRAEAVSLTPVLSVYGEIRSRRTLEIRATSPGRIVWLADEFEEGGEVREGALLVRIDPTDAETALKVAESDLNEARAEVTEAERSIELARVDLMSAESQAQLREQALARARDARSRGVGTDTAIEQAEITAAAAQQSVLSRRQALAQTEARAALAQSRLARQEIMLAEAGRAIDRTEIRADFSGTLSGVNVIAGRLVSNNERLGELIDPTALEVSFRLSALEYARLLDPSGRLLPLPIRVSLDVAGIDLSATGIIEREGAAVGQGQTGRQVFARLTSPRGLRPGDFVSVNVDETPLDNVVVLPATAVSSDQTVLVVGQEERLQRVPVKMIRRQGESVILEAGTIAGRDVVSEQTPLLGAGIRVRPMNPLPTVRPAEAQQVAVAADPELIELAPERRARLVAFVEANPQLPAEAKKRMIEQLNQPQVPAQVIARLESRMGG